MLFDNLVINFAAGMKYVACEEHGVYTASDSGRRDAWARAHGRCSQLRGYTKAPAGYESFLDPLEALASVAGDWEEQEREQQEREVKNELRLQRSSSSRDDSRKDNKRGIPGI